MTHTSEQKDTLADEALRLANANDDHDFPYRMEQACKALKVRLYHIEKRAWTLFANTGIGSSPRRISYDENGLWKRGWV